jgi:hypothetical protein
MGILDGLRKLVARTKKEVDKPGDGVEHAPDVDDTPSSTTNEPS